MGNERAKRLGTNTQLSVPTIEPEKLTLIVDKKHPLYDPRVEWPVNERLVKSIKKFGVKEPIHIRFDGKGEDGSPTLLVCDGRQRTKAAIEANRQLVEEGGEPKKVMIIQEYGEDADVLASVTLMLNSQRTGNTVVYNARMALRLHEAGKADEEIADALNCSVATVSNLFKVLDCSKKVQDAMEQGRITVDLAKKMSDLSREEQDTALDKLLADGGSLKGKKGRTKLANATGGKAGSASTAEAMSKKEIKTLLANLKMTIKASDEDPCLAAMAKVLEHVLGERKRCPFDVVEVTSKRRGKDDSAGGEE